MSNPITKAPTPREQAFPCAERDLAKELGLSVDDVAAHRKQRMERATHWELVKGRVCYSDAGRQLLHEILKISPENPPDSTPNESPASAGPKPGDVRELVCVKRFHPNFRLIAARLGDAPQRVRVRDNKNFVAGMTLQCRLVQDDLWDLVQRLPRWKGRY